MLVPFLGVAIAVVAGQKPTEPEAALRQSFDRKLAVNVDALVEKPFHGGDTIKVRRQYDGAGRRRTEIVAPLVLQGRVFIDDGATWTTYSPDQKLFRTHAAPSEEDLDAKMRLVRRNYRLEVDQRTSIAGRAAIRIVATPRAPDLRTQRYYLDATTFIPLKAETVDAIGGVSVQFTIRQISFPSRFDKDLFTLPSISGARREPGRSPIPCRSAEDAARRLGFRPAILGRLPMGFRPIGMDLAGRDDGRMPLAIRLSDGLVRLYVFQSRIGNALPPGPRPDGDTKTAQDVGDVRVEIRGDDVPASARERILAAYVWALQKNGSR